MVSDEELADALAECERANGDAPITIFEIETAAAFVLFAQHPADYLLLEVGLGGRLDATNVIERPLASVVTPVSMDHVEFLGDTIEKIAAEKAGIFRAGVPAVIAPQTDLVAAVLEHHAERARAPLHAAGQQWHSAVEHGRLVYQDEKGLLSECPDTPGSGADDKRFSTRWWAVLNLSLLGGKVLAGQPVACPFRAPVSLRFQLPTPIAAISRGDRASARIRLARSKYSARVSRFGPATATNTPRCATMFSRRATASARSISF